MAEFPNKAKVVIVGLGGIVGASIAHHLIERGWDDIVGIDKSGIPTDIGSTAHASDFCYTTSHDYLSVWTTQYSIDFFEKMGHYARIGGLEVARTGDDTWMEEIKRKLTSARAFGTRFRVYSIVSGVVLLAFGALTALEAPRLQSNLPTPWIGLWERINISVFLLWIVVLAAVLLMREWPPEVDAAQRAERSIA